MFCWVVADGRSLFIGAPARLLPEGGKEEASVLEPSVQKRAMEFAAHSSSEATEGPVSVSSDTSSSRLWRLSNFAMAVFFGLAGAVQVGGRPMDWVLGGFDNNFDRGYNCDL